MNLLNPPDSVGFVNFPGPSLPEPSSRGKPEKTLKRHDRHNDVVGSTSQPTSIRLWDPVAQVKSTHKQEDGDFQGPQSDAGVDVGGTL